jgi:hypothetical protein
MMSVVTAQVAYQRGWNRCVYYDDSEPDFEKARARFAAKHGQGLATAWAEGWADAASREV